MNIDFYDFVDSLLELSTKCGIITTREILLNRVTNPIWRAKMYCVLADLHLAIINK